LDILEERNVGTSAVFAEPGIGKSVAAVLAVLKAEVNQSHMTVLIRGEFSQNLRDFFRTTDAAVALKVA
jgi:precorrin-2 methylase